MAVEIPKWGDGSLWGDGDKWSRLYGSSPYGVFLEQCPQRVAVEVAYSGGDFYIDRLSLVLRSDPQREKQYQAYFHDVEGEHIAVEVSFANGTDFAVYTLRAIGQIKNKRY